MVNNCMNIIWREKKLKLVKESKIITQQPNSFENLNIVDIKLFTIEHPKPSRELFKTMMQTEMVSQVGFDKNSDSPQYSKTKNVKIIWMKIKVKLTKQPHAYKGYPSKISVQVSKTT